MSTALAGVGASDGQDKVVRIGFRIRKLVLSRAGVARRKNSNRSATRCHGRISVGPPLLEASMSAPSIRYRRRNAADLAQAAGARCYLVTSTAPQGEAILVPGDSPLKSVADLRAGRSRSTGLERHYLLVQALQSRL